MSGFVAVANLDGAPVDVCMLERMTASLSFRGPDRQESWFKENIGLGHTLLRTTFESATEQQPFSLDGQVWVTADARIDGRAELIRKLSARGRIVETHVPDVELILHAYAEWGDSCVDHLLGDFAFVIWDGRERSIFAARDHFGLKPFYYARAGDHLVCSNTLDTVRLHPAVSKEFNDLAIADCLVFCFNQEIDTTCFAGIRRLPPGHCLSAGDRGVIVRRYWQLPLEYKTIRYRREADYIEHFSEVFGVAVADRMRAEHVGIYLSGGLDSSAMAAMAVAAHQRCRAPLRFQAFTSVYDRLIPDRERHYAGLVAEALGIPVEFFPADDYGAFDEGDAFDLHTPEPTNNPLWRLGRDFFRLGAAYSRVHLNGQGGDEVLYRSSVVNLLGRQPVGCLLADVLRCGLAYRRRPALGLGTRLRRMRDPRRIEQTLPDWLNPDLVRELDLSDRVARQRGVRLPEAGLLRREAHAALSRAALFSSYLEGHDAGTTRIPAEVRFPYLDLRVIDFLMSIPPIPWCVDKLLLRRLLRGVVPEPVLRRQKTPLAKSFYRAVLPTAPEGSLLRDPVPQTSRYVDLEVLAGRVGDYADRGDPWLNLRPVSLNYWFRSWITGPVF